MKKQIFVATIVVALLGAGVYFYTKISKNINPPIPQFDTRLVGSWKIDSAFNVKDSNSLSLLVAFLLKDSSEIVFKTDSCVEVITGKSIDKQKYYLYNDSLFLKCDSLFEKNKLKFINDSIVELTYKDSTITLLHKVHK